MTTQWQGIPGDQREIVFHFFAAFSRFEYAMKAAGWARSGKGDAAEPDWDRVVKELKRAPEEDKARVRARAGILLTAPPRKQILRKGSLGWQEAGKSGDDLRQLIDSLKRVRNNLFHGGKYTDHGVYLSDRALQLMTAAHGVLEEMLTIATFCDVAERFRAYTPEEW